MPLFLLALVGCAYRVNLVSTPPGALVELPTGRQVTTPAVVRLRWAPFNEAVVRASARGYRPLEVDLRDTEVKAGRFLFRAFKRPRGEVELVLVPSHGPTGTWLPGEVE